jgi:ribonuclease-3 family protein
VEEVRFKELQALKKRAYAAFAAGGVMDVPNVDWQAHDPIALAFAGDAYYSLFLRHCLVDTGIPNVQVLHSLAAEFVSAKAQAHVYRHLKERLDEQEQDVCRRARNAYSQAPKSASVAEYHDATALEALVGYLYLSGRQERLDQIMEWALAGTKEYCSENHE